MSSCKDIVLLHLYLLVLQSVAIVSSARSYNEHHFSAEEDSNKFGDEEEVDTGRYKFAYGVEDHKTGDFKVHKEERDGDRVTGEYTVADADGSLRTVKYTADKINGFHVVISRAGNPNHEVIPAPAPSATNKLQSRSQNREAVHPIHRVHRPPVIPSIPSTPKPRISASDTSSAFSSNIPMKKYFPEVPQFESHSKKASRPTERQNTWRQKLIHENGVQYRQQPATSTPPPYKQWAMSQRVPEFQYQIPHGFKKAEDESTICPPSIMQSQNSVEQGDDSHDDHVDSYDDSQRHSGVRYNEYDVEDRREWKKDDTEAQQAAATAAAAAENSKRVNSFRNLYDMRIAHFGRQDNQKKNQGAFSYMNYEGETSSSYELQHDAHNKHKRNPDYVEFTEK